MRNLKRVLSLALALVMVLGMMVIGTSAATFTDADEITYTEAVEVMNALGIIEGYNGAFNPKGNLNRAGAAKLIAFMTMGAEADEYLTGSAAPFDDVAADHWAAKYVAYCSNLKIIDGNGDGTFNPDGNISVVGFAKLVLGAAGIAGEYTGANWENNVKNAVAKAPAMKATGIKITTANITREEAAALMLAGMKSGGTTTKYYYVVPTSVTTPEAITAANTIDKFESATDAYVMANIVTSGGTAAHVLAKEETSGTLLKNTYGVTYKAVDADKFGNPGVGYEKEVDGKMVIDLFFGKKADVVYTTGMNTEDGLKAIVADLKAAGVKFTEDFGNNNYRFSTGKFPTVDGLASADPCNSTQVLAQLTGANKIVKVYVDAQTKLVDLVTVENTYATTVKSVTEADAAKEIEASITLTAGDLPFKTDKFEKDDVVLYTKAWDGSKYVVQTVVEAEAVTGTLTSYTKDNKFTIGDKVYQVSNISGVMTNNSAVIAAMGKEMVYSLDANGKIVAVAEPGKAPVVAPVISDYAIVLDANGTVKSESVTWPAPATTYEITAQIKVLLSNGTVEIWDVPVVKADKDMTVGTTSVSKDEYYYLLGSKNATVVTLTGTDSDDATALTSALKAATGIYTYADKALVAPVTALTGAETKDATVQFANSNRITKSTYVSGGVVLNDKTVFVVKAEAPATGYVVKTGLAALENTEITNGIKVVAAVTAGKNQAGEPDTAKNVVVATVVFAEGDTFAKDTAVSTTDEYALVDGNYVVTVDGTDEYRTYAVTYADGTTGSVVVKNEAGDGMTTGAYKLKADGSIDSATGVTTVKTVKLVSGTTVIFTEGDPMTTTAKTVVVGGELAPQAKAYVVGTGAISIAFIVE